VLDVARGVEPSGPSLDQLLLQCLMHSAATSGWQNARDRAQVLKLQPMSSDLSPFQRPIFFRFVLNH
jgi:hypothetical protein